MKIIKGDLIELAKTGHFNMIVHGCNCFHTMNSGIALQIRKEWPIAYLSDCTKTSFGDRKKLGTYSGANLENLTIINMYTQFNYGRERSYVSYGSISKGFQLLRNNLVNDNKHETIKIGIPKIGSGLAGGDWDRIESILDEVTEGLDITVVEYDR